MGAARAKRDLRRGLSARRDALPAADRAAEDAGIAAALFGTTAWSGAAWVLTYVSVGSEVSTRAIALEALRSGKRVLVPRCLPASRALAWHEVRSLDALAPGAHGIPEPVPGLHPETGALRVREIAREGAVAVVPGLAFDRSGFRIGYGGGYYDGFLASFAGASVGLCRSGSLLDDLGALGALEPHDRPVSLIVTGEGPVVPRPSGRRMR